MAFSKSGQTQLLFELPKLLAGQAVKPLRLACRRTEKQPGSQAQFAALVRHALRHEIRAGFEHRFITLLFVTVQERVFCRRYAYGEPSWHSVFLADARGQVKLDKTIVGIEARIPDDLGEILPSIDAAYEAKLKQFGARFMLAGAVAPQAQQSTLEIFLAG